MILICQWWCNHGSCWGISFDRCVVPELMSQREPSVYIIQCWLWAVCGSCRSEGEHLRDTHTKCLKISPRANNRGNSDLLVAPLLLLLQSSSARNLDELGAPVFDSALPPILVYLHISQLYFSSRYLWFNIRNYRVHFRLSIAINEVVLVSIHTHFRSMSPVITLWDRNPLKIDFWCISKHSATSLESLLINSFWHRCSSLLSDPLLLTLSYHKEHSFYIIE